IRSTSTAPIHTTVNQVDAKRNASVDGQKVAPRADAQRGANPSWADNDRLAYVVATRDALRAWHKSPAGRYLGGAHASHGALPLPLDHGVQPTDASYEYIVLPAATADETEAYAEAPAVTVLRNDTAVQAVRHAGLKRTMATFFRAGSLDL